MSNLSRPEFHDEEVARAWLEAELWPNGPVCAHCKEVNKATKLQGTAHRAGVYQCNACREQFSVTVGTLYERSHIPLHTWLAVTHLMMASKKGMSALQISRMINRPYKTVWFMCHRIRESLKASPDLPPMGGEGKVIEADETYIGGKAKNRAFREPAPKQAVFTLIERDGHARSFHVATVNSKTLRPIIDANVSKSSAFMTDESTLYPKIGATFSMRHCEPQRQRIRPRLLLAYEHGRGLLQPLEARHFRHVPPRFRSASAPLHGGAGFQMEHAQDDGRRTLCSEHSRHCRKAIDVSATL